MSCILCEELPSLQNGLARRIETAEGPRLSVTFRLNQRYRWNNGDPVTADDVIFSWQVGADTRVPVAYRPLYRDWLDIRKIDDRTFEVITTVNPDYQSFGLFILNSKLDGPISREVS